MNICIDCNYKIINKRTHREQDENGNVKVESNYEDNEKKLDIVICLHFVKMSQIFLDEKRLFEFMTAFNILSKF